MECPGSVRMAEGLPDEAGDAARSGTACHMLLHDLLEGRPGHSQYLVDEAVTVPITFEMREHVGEVAEWVWDYLRSDINANAQSEVLVQIYGQDVWGTADVIISSPYELVVVDAKFGFNEVEAKDNPQLLSYLLGARLQRADLRTMRVVILQPRCGRPKEEIVTRAELDSFSDRLIAAVKATQDPDAPLRASAGACHWCPAAAVCPENQKLTLAIARNEFSIIPERLTPAQLSEILFKAKAIRQAVAAVEEYALQMLAVGRDLPGWKRAMPNTHRQWRDGAEQELIKAVPLLDIDSKLLYTVPELKSPAQVEKVLKMKPGGLSEYTCKPEGSPVLVPDLDPRPAISADFGVVADINSEKE
jgi:hypothetical protein